VSWVRRVLKARRGLRAVDTLHTLDTVHTLDMVDNLCTFCIPTGFLKLSTARFALLLSGRMILAPCGLTLSIIEKMFLSVL